jgi:cytosine permease
MTRMAVSGTDRASAICAKDATGEPVASLSAFPFANLIAMLVGGMMTAALAKANANPFGADNRFGYMNGKQAMCSHMWLLAIGLGVVGTIVAAGNVWAFLIEWLSLLGILVPPIGAIILVDQYAIRPQAEIAADWRPSAFWAWGCGSVVAFFVEQSCRSGRPPPRPRWSPASSIGYGRR